MSDIVLYVKPSLKDKLKAFKNGYLANYFKGLKVFVWILTLSMLINILDEVKLNNAQNRTELKRLVSENSRLKTELSAVSSLHKVETDNFRKELNRQSKRWCIG